MNKYNTLILKSQFYSFLTNYYVFKLQLFLLEELYNLFINAFTIHKTSLLCYIAIHEGQNIHRNRLKIFLRLC